MIGYMTLDKNAGYVSQQRYSRGTGSRATSAYASTQDAGIPNYIPIYSVDEIAIDRSQTWEVTPIARNAVALAIWMGGDLMGYNFDIQLMIGWGDVQDAAKLTAYMKLFNAMLSHQMNGDKVESPPAVHFYIKDIISATGILQQGTTKFLKPWSRNASGAISPRGVRFTGKFAFLPGYDQSKANGGIYGSSVDAKVANKVLSLDSVAHNFYVLDK